MAIPISMNTEQLGLRLLELPPELVTLLESDDAPTLHLKSSTTNSNTSASHAVLCTPDKTFEVRQVQSSNVLYILQETSDAGLTGIAQAKGMLELVPSKASAIEYLRRVLPVYTGDNALPIDYKHTNLVEDAPFSQEEIQDAARKLCAIEKDGKIWIPDASLLRDAWKNLLTSSIISGVKLDKSWSPNQLEQDESIDAAVYSAIVLRLSCTPVKSSITFDATGTTTWVGQILLRTIDEGMGKAKFQVEWQDLLPEAWRDLADMALLKDKYEINDDGFITSTIAEAGNTITKKPAVTSKSKWHAKFKR